MGDLHGYGLLGEELHGVLRGRYRAVFATTLLATLVLIGAWFVLSGIGALVDSVAGIDLGLGLGMLGLILVPLVILGVGRRVGLHGLGAWLIVGLGTFILAAVLYVVLLFLLLTLVLGYR